MLYHSPGVGHFTQGIGIFQYHCARLPWYYITGNLTPYSTVSGLICSTNVKLVSENSLDGTITLEVALYVINQAGMHLGSWVRKSLVMYLLLSESPVTCYC